MTLSNGTEERRLICCRLNETEERRLAAIQAHYLTEANKLGLGRQASSRDAILRLCIDREHARLFGPHSNDRGV